MSSKEMAEKAIRNTNHEIGELQAQLTETICGYTDMIERTQAQVSAPDAGTATMPEGELQASLQQGQAENRKLQKDVDTAKQKLA